MKNLIAVVLIVGFSLSVANNAIAKAPPEKVSIETLKVHPIDIAVIDYSVVEIIRPSEEVLVIHFDAEPVNGFKTEVKSWANAPPDKQRNLLERIRADS